MTDAMVAFGAGNAGGATNTTSAFGASAQPSGTTNTLGGFGQPQQNAFGTSTGQSSCIHFFYTMSLYLYDLMY